MFNSSVNRVTPTREDTIKIEGQYFSNLSVAFEQMFADMTSSPEVANQLISALRKGSNDSPIVATELIGALRADQAAPPGHGSPVVARELLNALNADASKVSSLSAGGSEVGIQTEDRTPHETRQTQVR